MNLSTTPAPAGRTEHATLVDGQSLFLCEKAATQRPALGVVLLVHGSATGGLPSFDLQVDGYVSMMDSLVHQGFDVWCLDHRGYGRSYKSPDFIADVAQGVEDLVAAVNYILAETRADQVAIYGNSSGALRAGGFAQAHPQLVSCLALDGFVWTGAGSPTLTERRKHIAHWKSSVRRPLKRADLLNIFTRDGVANSSPERALAFADAVLELDDSLPNGTYVDMCENLPLVRPELLTMPTLIIRGEHDGIAALPDILDFFSNIASGDKEIVMIGGAGHGAILQSSYTRIYSALSSFIKRVLEANPRSRGCGKQKS